MYLFCFIFFMMFWGYYFVKVNFVYVRVIVNVESSNFFFYFDVVEVVKGLGRALGWRIRF